ncbi:hypothetical protein DFH28DRAFT_904384 [Melampsora americana]|nr:hypothetical protein DFH28DRAFT_904384 [Melampsora americana]
MGWDSNIAGLLRKTVGHTKMTVDASEELIVCWNGLMERGRDIWNWIVQARNVQATGLDELEVVEQAMFVDDTFEEYTGQPNEADIVDESDNESCD